MTLLLRQMGSVVKGFSLEPETEPSLFYQASIGEKMISDIGDIRDLSTLNRSISDFWNTMATVSPSETFQI